MEKVFVHPECPFSPETFNLLAQFYENPNSDFYLAQKKDFLKYVEAPLKYIFSQVEELLPDFIKKYIKSKWERSGAIIETNGLQLIAYSVALGFEELNSLDDAQLTLRFENHKLTFGFCAKSEYIESIMDNYKCNYKDSVEAIKILNSYNLPHQHHVCLTPAIVRRNSEWPEISNILMTPQKSVKGLLRSLTKLADKQPEEVTLYKITYMQVAISLESKQVLRYSAKQLSHKIAQTFKQVFPLFLCCNLNDNKSPLVITQYFSVYEKEFNRVYNLEGISQFTGFQTSEINCWIRTINRKQQAILQGPPGTGKTFLAQKLAKHLIGGGDGFSDTIQFHPAYTYEDFIQGLRPQSQDGQLTYPIVPGRFL